jgi:class 3 adenylate cyclase
MWKLDLTFEKNLEKEFLDRSISDSIPIVRIGILLAVILYAIFGILDQYMLPITKNIAWIIRFAVVVPALILILTATYREIFKKIFSFLLIGTSLLVACGILLMMYFSLETEPGYKYYYTGLLLVIIWVGTFSQLSFKNATYVILTIIIGYVLVVAYAQDMLIGGFSNQNFPIFLNNSFFFISCAILAGFSSYVFEKDKRFKFLQNKKIETLFGQQVSKEIASELIKTSGELDNKLCKVTVMFLDIRDFTSFADSRIPIEVASFQNIVFSELIDIINTNRGIINQFLGDGIMATFGAPVHTDSHITDAIEAGYTMLKRVKQLGEEGKIPVIRMGIGIHTGRVLAGNIGNEYRKEYSITGSTVIIASRIEQLNKVFGSQFLISEDIYKEIKDLGYKATYINEVELKGVKNPQKIYKLA